MAYDVYNAISGTTTTIRNGSKIVFTPGIVAVTTSGVGESSLDSKLAPILITSLYEKYDDRLDDPRYYTGDSG